MLRFGCGGETKGFVFDGKGAADKKQRIIRMNFERIGDVQPVGREVEFDVTNAGRGDIPAGFGVRKRVSGTNR